MCKAPTNRQVAVALQPASAPAQQTAEPSGEVAAAFASRPGTAVAADSSPTRSPLGVPGATWAFKPSGGAAAVQKSEAPAPEGGVRRLTGKFETVGKASQLRPTATLGRGADGGLAAAAAESAAEQDAEDQQLADR